jgi:hypothetical protein
VQFTINVFDNDYRSFVGSEVKEFATLRDAVEYCKENTWSGETYQLDQRHAQRGRSHPMG